MPTSSSSQDKQSSLPAFRDEVKFDPEESKYDNPEDYINYSESADNRAFDREKTEKHPEMRQFCLEPNESRSYYHSHDPEKKKDWYDLALMSTLPEAIDLLEPNKIYISRTAGLINYTVLTKSGRPVSATTTIPAPEPFTIERLMPSQSLIEEAATKASHIEHSLYTYYENVPCVNFTKNTLERELQANANNYNQSKKKEYIVNEGSVGLIMNKGRPQFVAPGEHVIYEDGVEWCGIKSLNEKVIQHGSMCIVNVSSDELYCVAKPVMMDDFRLLTPGLHVFNLVGGKIKKVIDPYGLDVKIERDADEKATPEEVKGAPQEVKKEAKKRYRNLFVRIPQGKVGICYDNQGQLTILSSSKEYSLVYLPASWTFYSRMSCKKTPLVIPSPEEVIDDKGVVQKGSNGEPLMREIPFHCKTLDGITVEVIARVHYTIEAPYYSVLEYGPNKIQKTIQDAALLAVIEDVSKKSLINPQASNYTLPPLLMHLLLIMISVCLLQLMMVLSVQKCFKH